jgi:hypothetical protein
MSGVVFLVFLGTTRHFTLQPAARRGQCTVLLLCIYVHLSIAAGCFHAALESSAVFGMWQCGTCAAAASCLQPSACAAPAMCLACCDICNMRCDNASEAWIGIDECRGCYTFGNGASTEGCGRLWAPASLAGGIPRLVSVVGKLLHHMASRCYAVIESRVPDGVYFAIQ